MPNKGKLFKDPAAAAGVTASRNTKLGINKEGAYFCLYDRDNRKTLNRTGLIPLKDIVPNKYKLYKLITGPLSRRCLLVLSRDWHLSFDLSPHFLFTFPNKKYEIWASMKFAGPDFDPKSKAKENTISCDQVFLVKVEK